METTTDINWTTTLTEIYTVHFDALVGTANRILHDRSSAEDAVQDCFVRYAAGGCNPAPGSELAYLRTMVRNQALTKIRRTRCGERAQAALQAIAPTIAPPAETEALLGVQAEELVAELSSLSTRQQQVLGLRCLAGYSVDETARRLDISSGSVKTHSHRGSGSLQDRLRCMTTCAA